MGKIHLPAEVKLIMAITFRPDFPLERLFPVLSFHWGEIDLRSPIYDFTHTHYYEAEMGKGLRKQFVSFRRLICPESLPAIKHLTNALEAQFSSEGKRTVNLDPGYVEGSKMVLATTKNYSHRVYIGAGIYGDVQYRFMNGSFRSNDWTYPDYQEPLAIDFFNQVRERYREQLKTLKSRDME